MSSQEERLKSWLVCDYLFDLVYLADLLVFKHRLLFMENGFWVRDRRRITRNYVQQSTFWHDALSLAPTDVFYYWLGPRYTIVRLPRLIKVVAFWEFVHRLDAKLSRRVNRGKGQTI